MHVVEGEVLFVVVGHEGVVQAEDSIGVGLGDDLGDEGVLVVVEVHVAHQQQVALEFVVLLALEERGSDEEQLQLLQLVQLENSYFFLCFLVGAEEAPLELGQAAEVFHLGDPEGGVLGDDDGCSFYFLVQDLD